MRSYADSRLCVVSGIAHGAREKEWYGKAAELT